MLRSVLLLDSHFRTLDVLAFAFERDGYHVFRAHEVELGAEIAKHERPQIVIFNVGSEDTDARHLCSIIRHRAEFEGVPLLVVAEGVPRQELLEAGASAYLARPVYLRDVVTLARVLVDLAPAREAGNRLGLEGRLADYGLYFLMRALAAAGFTAVLALTRQGRRGEIYFSGGEITAAQLAGVTGPPAIHAMLLWLEATLSLRLTEVNRVRRITQRSEETLAECERFLRDFRAAAAAVGEPETVLAQDIAFVAAQIATIPAQVAPVLRLFDGRRTLADVAADSPFTAFDSMRIAGRLREFGAIKPVETARAAAEVVRGEILTAARPGAASGIGAPPVTRADEPKVVVDGASLAERLEAMLVDQSPIPLPSPLAAAPPAAAPSASSPAPAVAPAALPPPIFVAVAPAPAAPPPAAAAPAPEAPAMTFNWPPALVAVAPPPPVSPPATEPPPVTFNWPPIAVAPPAAVAPAPAPAPVVAAPPPALAAPVPAPAPVVAASPPALVAPAPAPAPVVAAPPVVAGTLEVPPAAPSPPVPAVAAPSVEIAPAAAESILESEVELPPPRAPEPASVAFSPRPVVPLAAASSAPVAAAAPPAPAVAPAAGAAPPAPAPAAPALAAAPAPPRPAPAPEPAAALTPALAPGPAFSALEEDFFAREHEHLAAAAEQPDTFEDLEDPPEGRSRWFGGGNGKPVVGRPGPRGGNGKRQ